MPVIALVDDDRNILTSVSIALEGEGHRLMTYSDGVSALAGFKASPPDLAILDIKMPRMDGMELLRRMRQSFDLPVILLTSSSGKYLNQSLVDGTSVGRGQFMRGQFIKL